MSTPRLIVTRRWPEAVEKILAEKYDAQLNVDDVPMTTAELQDAFRTADAVLPTVSDRIDAEVLGATEDVRERHAVVHGHPVELRDRQVRHMPE